MKLVQSKLRQKELLTRLKIPTSPYLAFPEGTNLTEWLHHTLETFDHHAVLKWAEFGYDGKGTFFLKQTRHSLKEGQAFCTRALSKGISVYAEEKINFQNELAIVACHSIRNEFATYPLVISEQNKGICLRVHGPATALGVSETLQDQAVGYAQRLAYELPLNGTFAIEFFQTQTGRLVVNEVAPRVHNSGHFSLDASSTSQFENHLRAILGLPLGDTSSAAGFSMLNLLGSHFSSMRPPLSLSIPQKSHLHWYGKAEFRPGRKLGHVNAMTTNASETPALIHELELLRKRWERLR